MKSNISMAESIRYFLAIAYLFVMLMLIFMYFLKDVVYLGFMIAFGILLVLNVGYNIWYIISSKKNK